MSERDTPKTSLANCESLDSATAATFCLQVESGHASSFKIERLEPYGRIFDAIPWPFKNMFNGPVQDRAQPTIVSSTDIRPGDSGGPQVDADQKAIGGNVARPRVPFVNVTFDSTRTVPAEYVRDLMARPEAYTVLTQ